jgi:hypothetical protein
MDATVVQAEALDARLNLARYRELTLDRQRCWRHAGRFDDSSGETVLRGEE